MMHGQKGDDIKSQTMTMGKGSQRMDDDVQ